MKQLLFFLFLMGTQLVFAQFGFFSGSSSSTAKGGIALDENEKLIRQKIKNRAFPGGYDEEPLRVQTQLNPATRKMNPVQEAVEEPAAPGETAHD